MTEAMSSRRTNAYLGAPRPPQILEEIQEAAAKIRRADPKAATLILALCSTFERLIIPTVQVSANQAPPLRGVSFDVAGVVVFDYSAASPTPSAAATQLRLGLVGGGQEAVSATQPAADFIQGGSASGGVGIASADAAAVICAQTIPSGFAAVVTFAGWEPSSAGGYRDIDVRLGLGSKVVANMGSQSLPRGSASFPGMVHEVIFPRAEDQTLDIRARNLSTRYPYIVWGRVGGYMFPTKQADETIKALNRLEVQ